MTILYIAYKIGKFTAEKIYVNRIKIKAIIKSASLRITSNFAYDLIKEYIMSNL